ncbi:nicotinamide N-methyltransferase-like [Daphnia pulicaria]|uniref:nicotinamide N-methyltransferase-like n=1 Tax=Daphnia pulicaria TaxID=35523 RepID=UPI001EEA8EDC|nr:nicotinamide N-methyltransferase-like [Daphnia pulicaria]
MMESEAKRLALEQLYRDKFRPEEYLSTYYRTLDAEVEFFLRNLHHFFFVSNGGHHDGTFQEHEKQVEVSDDEMNKKKKGRRVLEIGSGPVPISMISASRWSEWIVCSDFLEQNRQNIKQWLLTMTATTTSAAPGRHDDDETWLPFFRYVTELERAESETLLLERVRHSVRAVVPCNVLLTNPLMNDKEAAQNADGNSLYDVIITTLCLEFATLSVDEYSAAVGNVTRLLSPGGFLVVQGALGNSHYWHNNHQFPSVTLSRAVVESAVKKAGCLLVDWRELARCCPLQNKPADHSAVFYCLARKNQI